MTSVSIDAPGPLVNPRSAYEVEREAYRIRRTKLVLMLMLGICFWYAVPYQFPLRLDPDPFHAAANEAQAYEGNLSRQLAMPVVLLISLFAVNRLPRVGTIATHSRLFWGALAYAGWVLASVLWSADPALSAKRLLVFAINAVFIVALARTTTVRELALLGVWCTGSVAFLALIADAVVLHTFAPFNPDYRFMGVMTANYQAINLFVGLACGLTLLQERPRSPVLLAFIASLSLLLLLTRARIGTVLFVAMAVVVAMRLARRKLGPVARAFACVVLLTLLLPVGVFAAGGSGSNALMNLFMMGRQDTENTSNLSNRAPLWSELATSVAERPWFGSGFEAFWTAQEVERISLDQGWVVPHAHNTYLDQTLSVGLVGAALYAAVVWSAVSLAWKQYRRTQGEMDLLPLLLLSWLALLSLTESLPVAPNLPTLIAYSCIPRMFMTTERVAKLPAASSRAGSLSQGQLWSAPV